MKWLSTLVLLVGLAGAAGCGAQSILLGTEGSYLLTASDGLALPGEEVELRARFQGGDLLRGQQGVVVRFTRDGQLYKAAETDSDGVAAVTFAPPDTGDYRFVADVAPTGLPDDPPPPQEFLIACRPADGPMVVVDLDKTVVASGFQTVLLGDPAPMPRSPEVLKRMAAAHTIVFLTHRPDYFGPKSKAWLKAKGYPSGPLLLSTAGGFFKGSGAFKSGEIEQLRKRFKQIRIGIGDKVSDVEAYHKNGLKAFLILQVADDASAASLEVLADDIKGLPDGVQVVTAWDEIEKAVFSGGSYPASPMEKRLRDLAAARKKKEEAAKK